MAISPLGFGHIYFDAIIFSFHRLSAPLEFCLVLDDLSVCVGFSTGCSSVRRGFRFLACIISPSRLAQASTQPGGAIAFAVSPTTRFVSYYMFCLVEFTTVHPCHLALALSTYCDVVYLSALGGRIG